MRIYARSNRSGRSRRGAFTLMELLVVVSIMLALVALTASGVLKFAQVQQTSNTQSTLDRVQSQLARAWSKVKDDALRTAPSSGSPIYQLIQNSLAGTDPNAAGRIKVIYVKLKLRQAFPMNFAEAFNVPYTNPEMAVWGLPTLVPSSPLPALPAYVSYLTSLGITPAMVSAQPAPQSYESSACLLMALQRGVSGAGINPSELTAGGAAGSIPSPANPNLGSLPYLTDAWGLPIFFSRFPTGCPLLNPAGALVGNNDPGDPLGCLNSPVWQTQMAPGQIMFSQLCLQALAPKSSPPLSYKLAPMVASGGWTNWTKPGQLLPFDIITFAPVVPNGTTMYSTP